MRVALAIACSAAIGLLAVAPAAVADSPIPAADHAADRRADRPLREGRRQAAGPRSGLAARRPQSPGGNDAGEVDPGHRRERAELSRARIGLPQRLDGNTRLARSRDPGADALSGEGPQGRRADGDDGRRAPGRRALARRRALHRGDVRLVRRQGAGRLRPGRPARRSRPGTPSERSACGCSASCSRSARSSSGCRPASSSPPNAVSAGHTAPTPQRSAGERPSRRTANRSGGKRSPRRDARRRRTVRRPRE